MRSRWWGFVCHSKLFLLKRPEYRITTLVLNIVMIFYLPFYFIFLLSLLPSICALFICLMEKISIFTNPKTPFTQLNVLTLYNSFHSEYQLLLLHFIMISGSLVQNAMKIQHVLYMISYPWPLWSTFRDPW